MTTNLAAPGSTDGAAAGNTWRLVAESLGRRIGGTILAPRIGQGSNHRPARTERIGAFEVLRVRPRRPIASLDDAIRGPGALRVAGVGAGLWLAVRRALRTSAYDLVHAFWAFPSGAAAVFPSPDIPVLVSCPGSDLHTWSGRPISKSIIKSVLRRAHAVTCQSTTGLEIARGLGARELHSLPVCFDPLVFRVAAGIVDEPVVVYAGRMTRAKGVFVLAEALRRLSARVPNVRLVCCGTGPDAGDFERAVRHALGDRATFHGPVPPWRVAEILAGARVAVLPSFGEGMSASAIEALASGRPLVTTDTGEHVSLVRRGGGSIVGVGDAEGLALALERELASPRRPELLRALVERFTPDYVADRLTEIYELIAEERPVPATNVGRLAGVAAARWNTMSADRSLEPTAAHLTAVRGRS